MWIPKKILNLIPRGHVLLNESNPKNEALLKAALRRHRLKGLWAGSLSEAQRILEKKKVLGVILDHEFRNDTQRSGMDLLHYIRREKSEELRGLPVFLVSRVETATLQEYEYLKINHYFDTEDHRVVEVIREMEPYFIERD